MPGTNVRVPETHRFGWTQEWVGYRRQLFPEPRTALPFLGQIDSKGPLFSNNCFPDFPLFFPRKTGKSRKNRKHISKAWKFNRGPKYLERAKIFGTLRIPILGFFWGEMWWKCGNTKNFAKKNSRNLDEKPFDKNGPNSTKFVPNTGLRFKKWL